MKQKDDGKKQRIDEAEDFSYGFAVQYRDVLRATGTTVLSYDIKTRTYKVIFLAENYEGDEKSLDDDALVSMLCNSSASKNGSKKIDGLISLVENGKETQASHTVRLKTKGGQLHWYRIRVMKAKCADANCPMLTIILNDIDEQIKSDSALLFRAQRDALTGLYNREAFLEEAAEMIAKQKPGYYIMACFNIDSFKVINDLYGLEKGDRVLKHVASVFRDGFDKAGGICCRITADKFAVLYPYEFSKTQEIVDIRKRASHIDASIGNVTFSIGRYVIEDKNLPISSMFDRAAIAEATVQRRFDFSISDYNEAMREKVLREQEIVSEMELALKNRNFEVWLHPQYNHASGAIFGCEALVRWHHPTKGIIPPSEFIPVFERNGFIYELDKFVWEETCAILKRRLDKGDEPLPISVNVSRYDIYREDFFETITGLVEKYELPTSLLRLEITETAFAESTGKIIENVKRLAERGFLVEIDDFGSGYSSLNTLKDVPAAILKLDMRFLENNENSSRGGNILESVVRMAKRLSMPVIAEGVETKEQADFLKSIGCNYVQGYLYAKPMPVVEFEKLALSHEKETSMFSLETVEALDNNAFWDPKSMETLIFNSYIGGACVFEYGGGRIELLRANDKYAEAVGGNTLSLEKSLSLQWEKYMSRDVQYAFLDAVKQAISSNKEIPCEIVLTDICVDGKKTHLLMEMRVIARMSDRYLFYCTVDNITAQRVAEENERIVSEQMNIIMQNINCGVSAGYFIDGELKYLFENEQYHAMYGYTKEQFRSELPSGVLDLIYPDDIEYFVDAVERTLLTSKTVIIEYRAYKRDGSLIYVRSNGGAIRINGIDSPVRIAISSDITKEKENERKIKEASSQLKFLNDISAELLSTDNTNQAIDHMLKGVLEYFSGTRAYVFEISADGKYFNNTYEVCASGTSRELENLQNIPISALPIWNDMLNGEKYINIESLDALDKDCKEERELLAAQGVSSLVAVPIHRRKKLIGFMGVDDPTDNTNHVSSFAALGDYIAVMLSRRDADEKIMSDNKMLLNMMNDTPGGFVRFKIVDGNFQITNVNSVYCDMIAMTRDEVMKAMGDNAASGIHPDDMDMVIHAVTSAVKTRETISLRHRIRHRGGGYIWVRFFGRITTGDAEQLYLNAYFTDLSKEMELEKQQRDLLENLPCGAAIYEFSDDLIHSVYLNSEFEKLVGKTGSRTAFKSSLEFVHPDDRARLIAEIKSALKENRLVKCDLRVLTKENTYALLRATGNPSRRGEKIEIYATYTPISVNELSYSEMLPLALDAMLKSTTDLTFVKDKNLKYICCSNAFAKMVGRECARDVAGKTDFDLFDKELAEKYISDDKELFESGKSIINKIEAIPSENGILRYSCTSKHLLFDTLGNIIGLLGTGRDVTDGISDAEDGIPRVGLK